ncbi:hypothetical protein F5Y17DRAFT_48689 [Xylariaceae sp. FL0594]|nr:hypothetical protein F5Y17DRAFT_48689 [Xylariaceae sp. FL0594]
MDITKDHSTATTIGGYAVLALICGYVYYTSQAKNRRTPIVKHPIGKADRDLATDTKKKAEKAIKPKPKPKPAVADRSEPVAPSISYNKEDNEVADKKADLDFARQLSSTHAGTKFTNKKSDDKRQKSVKQSKAQETTAAKTSAPSSTGDADDDLSPQVSPVVAAADSKDVSDMLEPVASGPSVLRLTGTDSATQQKPRKVKAPEPVETKKQRQNRKKAEAAKAAREEDEKERKIKMEQQRRTARIAEGRPAKDGSAFIAAQSAWKSQSGDSDAPVPLLDTFERKDKPQVTKPVAPAPAAVPAAVPAAAPKAAADPWSSLPSEEEQLEMIRQEDSWNEVKTKKKGKKKETLTETPTPLAQSTNGVSVVPAAPVSQPVNSSKRPIITSSSSSFAALTPEEAADDDEPEEEWDV